MISDERATYCIIIKHFLGWKINFLKKSDDIGYVIETLLKYVKISMHIFSSSFYRGFNRTK